MDPAGQPFRMIRCGKCGHDVAGRMARCFYCGAPIAPPADAPKRSCPRCRTDLGLVTARWVSIDRCGSCSGEFYDPTELDRVHFFDEPSRRELTRLVEPRLRQPGPDERIGCPGCGHSMEIVDVAAMKPFQIDVCPKCKGTWLDGGEAEHLRSLVGAKVGGGGPVPIVPTAASPYDGEGSYVPDAGGAELAADAVDLAVDAAFFLSDILSD